MKIKDLLSPANAEIGTELGNYITKRRNVEKADIKIELTKYFERFTKFQRFLRLWNLAALQTLSDQSYSSLVLNVLLWSKPLNQ